MHACTRTSRGAMFSHHELSLIDSFIQIGKAETGVPPLVLANAAVLMDVGVHTWGNTDMSHINQFYHVIMLIHMPCGRLWRATQ